MDDFSGWAMDLQGEGIGIRVSLRCSTHAVGFATGGSALFPDRQRAIEWAELRAPVAKFERTHRASPIPVESIRLPESS